MDNNLGDELVLVIEYKLECGALNSGKWYASRNRYPVFLADTLSEAIWDCVKHWKNKID